MYNELTRPLEVIAATNYAGLTDEERRAEIKKTLEKASAKGLDLRSTMCLSFQKLNGVKRLFPALGSGENGDCTKRASPERDRTVPIFGTHRASNTAEEKMATVRLFKRLKREGPSTKEDVSTQVFVLRSSNFVLLHRAKVGSSSTGKSPSTAARWRPIRSSAANAPKALGSTREEKGRT